MWTVYADEGNDEWVKTGQTYNDITEAYDDYGDENVRPITPTVYALHADERGEGVPPDIAVKD